MNAEELERIAQGIKTRGPDRVVINDQGEAVPPARARANGFSPPDVIFVRNDGWSLGASYPLWETAQSLWEDDWAGVMLRCLAWSYRPWSQYHKLLEMAADVIALREAKKDEAEDIDSWAQRLVNDVVNAND